MEWEAMLIYGKTLHQIRLIDMEQSITKFKPINGKS